MQSVFIKFFDAILAQHHRWILWCPVFMAFGIGIYFSLISEPSVYIGPFFLAVMLAFLCAAWRVEWLRILVFVLLFIVLGFSAASYRTQVGYTPMLEGEVGPTLIAGDVAQVDHEPSGIKILLEKAQIEDINTEDTPRYIRLKLAKRYGVPEIGARIEVLGVLLPPSPPVSPFSYDFQRHMYFQGIGATGYAVREFEVTTDPETSPSIKAEPLREIIKSHIMSKEEAKDEEAVLIALLTGERRLIPEAIWEDIRKAGIAHLLAISGLHIGLVAGFVFFIMRSALALIPPVALRFPIKKISAAFAFLAALGYCWLIGASIPAQRAVLMTGIVLFAVLIDRVAISLRLAAFAAVVVLLFSPESLFTPSFQMSFAAVVSLIAFYEVYRNKYAQMFYGYGFAKRIAIYLMATFITSVVASIATAPFALYHFQRVAMLPGLLANMIAVPMAAFIIMPMGFCAMIFMPFGGEGIFIEAAQYGIKIVLDVAHWAAAMPGSVAYSQIWPQYALVVIVLGALWICIWQGRLKFIGVPVLLFGIILSMNEELPDILISPEGKQIAVYDRVNGQLLFSDKRAERFTRNMWRDEYGGIKASYWPSNGISENDKLSCDAWGCVYRGSSKAFAFLRDIMAAYKDCSHADIVITPQFYDLPNSCENTDTITRGDLKEKGGHAIYLGDHGYTVKTVLDQRGIRPWTQ